MTSVVLGLPVSASAAAEAPCTGGVLRFLQGTGAEASTIEGVRVTGLTGACDGQVVGARFVGNDAGDPDLPTGVLAMTYSDEDPCTGDDLATPLVVTGGVIDIPLCETSATAGFVDGHDLTDVRLITPAGVAGGDPVTVVDPGPDGVPDPGGAADPEAAPLARTGADALVLALVGALAFLLGAGMLRASRRRPTH